MCSEQAEPSPASADPELVVGLAGSVGDGALEIAVRGLFVWDSRVFFFESSRRTANPHTDPDWLGNQSRR